MTREEKRRILNDVFFKPSEMIVGEKTLNHLVDTLDDVCYQLSPTVSKLSVLKDELKDIRRVIKTIEDGSKVS